ncbi:urea ABC transporter permease subunit UrtC [Arthrobacter sunyaminii]|uniref:Urea ABC transporter permease subunit UrtC n=1 Tax=Arthrobacter sunyaminii TaxID=2816859 RepID=A0A975S704_9MICC|nr:urea ABC transporter permease subunit UrtC [Arthrobacter sunyaminii]MBO0896222.1 urea ABC transporter permease subunit UrtC [Arthrobacter sunyaminii]MBO0907929.1 urea ABC transporter permease subunit UrtC [Arthrobacter sunyaminii]QWQ36978.1 urea ABC transporter permease subunit UrtC [Arthrobacter sunyaminii]
MSTDTVRSTTGGFAARLSSVRQSRAGVLAGFAAAAVLLLVAAPALLPVFSLGLFGKFLCFAIVAVGIGLAWGRGGMLTLGQGVFFGLGAYIMAMHMKLADAALFGGSGVPDFMALYGTGTVPGWWEPFRSPVVTVLAVVLVPGLVALVLGLAIFKRRVKGAYFAILSQALAAAFAVLLIGQQATTGGSNGLSGFRSFFGFDLADPANKRMLYLLTAVVLLLVVAAARQLMHSRFGELLVAVRDQEERVRFLGYDPATVKTVVYVLAAVMAGVAGALFVPLVGIISPADVGVTPSIAFLIGVAIGGRSTVLGPVLGALGVAIAQTSLASSFPSFWVYFQGLLFVLVIGFLPGGLASLPAVLGRLRRKRNDDGGAARESGPPTSAPPVPPAVPPAPAVSAVASPLATVPAAKELRP